MAVTFAKFTRRRDGALSSHDQVARALASEIITGAYPPGSKIPGETEILERFGISRTVLREVLKTLAAKGLVVSKTRVGTKVLEPFHWNFFDPDMLAWKVAVGMDDSFRRELAEIRLAIESQAAALAAVRRTDGQVAAMRAAVAAMRAETSDRRLFAEADLAFHQLLIEAAGNSLMYSISAVIETALVASFTISSPVDHDGTHRDVVDSHARIVDAVERRDPRAAAKAVAVVIDAGLDRHIAKESSST
jgi:DNA-binding FadR family transcriptional regulator